MKRIIFACSFLSLTTWIQAQSTDVYFGTRGQGSKGIYHATFDSASGKLSQATVAAEIGSPGFLALHPDGDKLYAVADDGQPCVASYKIGRDGGLSLINTEPIGDGGGAHLAVHPSKKFLITAQYGGGSVAVFPVMRSGALGKRRQLIEHKGGSGVVESRQNAPHPHWTGFSPDGQFAFVPDLGLDQIIIYRINERRSTLKQHGVAQSVPGGGPRHMRFSADGKFIYLLNELTLSVTTFAYDAENGKVERKTTTPALTQETKSTEAFNSASEILVHPNGRFVYSANRGDDTVTVYHANPETGRLMVREVENVRGSFPRNINLDPTGKWLLAAGQHSNTVAVFAIDQKSGDLTFQTGAVINVPGPICILFRN